MPRNTDLATILFPVSLEPIHCGEAGTGAKVPGYRAVVRKDRNQVLSVVSTSYELLPNLRAIEMGKAAFHTLFPDSAPEAFKIYDIKTTKSGSACSIDLIDPGWRMDVWEQETWLPFLRVSNSYNRSRALSFDFGFVRKLCANGIIFNQRTVRAKYTHTKGQMDVNFDTNPEFKGLKELEAQFTGHLKFLRETSVEKDQLSPLALFLLDLSFSLEAKDTARAKRESERLAKVSARLNELAGTYLGQGNPSLYTALNMATDFASHSPKLGGNFATAQKLQAKVGQRSRDIETFFEGRNELELLIAGQRLLLN